MGHQSGKLDNNTNTTEKRKTNEIQPRNGTRQLRKADGKLFCSREWEEPDLNSGDGPEFEFYNNSTYVEDESKILPNVAKEIGLKSPPTGIPNLTKNGLKNGRESENTGGEKTDLRKNYHF